MICLIAQRLSKRQFGVTLCVVIAALIAIGNIGWRRAHGQGGNPVTSVSAASFETAPVAPETIVAAFGSSLATRVEAANSLPLPTTLAGTRVLVKDSAGIERLAPLFFVAPSQVNYLVPAGAADGAAAVTITNGDGVVSTGTVQIARVAPGLFSANASGQGVPAAVALRIKADGSRVLELVARFDQTQDRFVPIPIDLGPEGEQVFLILFGTGIRGRAEPSSVVAKVGGVDAEVLYAGLTPDFVGLDQVNLRLPRSLAGRGRVNLAVAANGFSASNLVEVEIASPAGSAPPTINSFSPVPALAGQTVVINGSGFSPNPAAMLVRIAGNECRIISVSPQLSCQVPFGARSGLVSVRTPLGEGSSTNPLPVRTSVSGIVETANRQPLSGVRVRLLETTLTAQTNAEGAFILPDAPARPAGIVEVDGTSVPSLPFPKLQIKLRVNANQDNQIERPVSLQQITGATITVGGRLLTDATASVPLTPEAMEPADTIQTGAVVFEIPAGAAVRFPDGATSGTLTLTLVGNSRTPVNLPSGIFSPVIVQISPFGAVITLGGKLTFPNPDGFPAGSKVTLFRLDQTANSPTLGSFIEAGVAMVSADGQRIETATDAVKETSYYFVANTRPTTTVIGRVVDADGKTPVRRAVVRAQGQETFTDGNGGFILRNIPVKAANDQLTVEASFVRPSGRVDRTQRSGIVPVVGGITTVTPDLVLPEETSNRTPVIIAPLGLTIKPGETRDVSFTAYDSDSGQTIQVAVSGAPFARVTPGSNDSYALRLAPGVGDAGAYTLTLTARDNEGASASHQVSLNVTTGSIACGQTITGNITLPGQQDSYTFSGNAGEAVYITAAATSGDLAARLELYGPAGAFIAANVVNNTTGTVMLRSTGVHTVLVKDSSLTKTGAYALSLQFTTGRCATSIISCGQTVSGNIAGVAKVDVYTFNANSGEAAYITAMPTSGNLAARVDLYSPAGAFIATNSSNNTTGAELLPITGTYTVLVRDTSFNKVGAYELNLQFTTGRCAASISCGQTVSGNIAGVARVDAYTFNANSGEAVYVSAMPTSGNLAARVELYGPTGTFIATNNFNNTTGTEVLRSTGTYTILVRDSTFNKTGAYALNLQFTTGRCATNISCGQTVSGEIASAAQVATYKFSANAGEAVYIAASPTSGNLATRVELYNPAGALIGATGVEALPTTGTYTVLVRDSGLNKVGGYALNLQFTTGRCAAIISCGQTVSGNIGGVARVDAYTFSANSGEAVYVSALPISGNLAARVEIYGPTGAIIAVNGANNTTGARALLASGTYTILVRDSSFDKTGAYALNLQFATGRCGRSISSGQLNNGNIASVAQVDAFTFFGRENGTASITIVETSGTLVARVELYNPAGAFVGTNGAGSTTGNLTLRLTGTYTILVRDSGLNKTGAYNVGLSCIGTSCNPALNPAPPSRRAESSSTGAGSSAHNIMANATRSRGRVR